MDPGIIWPALARAAAKAATVVGRRVGVAVEQHLLAEDAARIVLAENVEPFISQLNDKQAQRLSEFLRSAEFDGILRQTIIYSLAGISDENKSIVRQQIWHALRHGGEFAEADLLQAVDILEELAYVTTQTVRASVVPGVLTSGYAISIAARVAAAGVRNSSLLAHIDSLTEINEFADALRSAARLRHGKLRLTHTGQNQEVAYQELYVAPNLVREGNTLDQVDVTSARPEELPRICLRSVVLGDPGAGKSTLVGKLTHDLAMDRISSLEGQVPIVLVVREHTTSLRTQHETILHYLEAACRRPANVNPPPDAIEYLLLNGRATVFIDGVDELGDSAYRTTFARLVDGFAHRFPLTRIIVTSRKVGYDEAPLDRDLFQQFRMSPFGDEEIHRYATQWFGLDRSRGEAEQQTLTAAFLKESVVASDLRSNPLLLSLLCSLYSSVHFIPRNKPEIYERCAELLFETWDRSRNIETVHRYGAHIKPAVQRLAWLLFRDREGRNALPRSEILPFLTAYMKTKRFEDEDEAAQAASDFLRFCAGRAWVLTDIGSDALQPHYGFVHRTFLEFFAASQLVKHQPSAQAVWQQLRPHIGDAGWDVVNQLSVQILDRHCDDGAEELLRLVLAETTNDSANPDDHQARCLVFAARCLAVVAPDNKTLREIVSSTVTVASGVSRAERRSLVGQRTHNVDAAVTHLTNVVAPDNVNRVAQMLTPAIITSARTMPEDSSAGLVYSMFLTAGRLTGAEPTMVLRSVSESLRSEPIPDAVHDWHRLLTKPTDVQLEKYGVRLLYEWTSIFDAAFEPVIASMIKETVAPGLSNGTEWPRLLSELYPSIFAARHELARLKLGLERQRWSVALAFFQEQSFQSLTREARGSVVLLLIPVVRTAVGSVSSSSMQRFFAAQGRSHRAAEMAEILESWQLPQDASEFLLQWVTGEIEMC